MRRILAVTLAVTALTAAWAVPAQAEPAPLVKITKAQGEKVPGQYIVSFKSDSGVNSAVKSLNKKPLFTYDDALDGFAAKLSAGELSALQHNPNVAMIEEDGVVKVDTTQSNATWGIDRIDQRNLPLSTTYTYNSTGSGVTAYIIDTGIAATHSQFGGRASNVYNSAGGSNSDCNGHGTHVAGTVGSATYGVAKGVALRGVKVLNCQGSGSWSGVISGMDWVTANHAANSVANMSLGGAYNASVNAAATRMANAGVFTAVAAGNENTNACNRSPASASNVTTVAASDRTDTKASFSNYGNCVEVYGPGVSITSTWLTGTNTISGTSMASPHVAGVGALYKAVNGNVSSATVNSWIASNATSGVIKSNPSGTPNRLVYKANL
ncbi:S8 family peptidase [Stackebrandtia nassauensis]|uniref:Peptidase S8 and S53 subtilisin kexin sedolisin n=1 Tax=Stackebrandtia nassauensis (strain DSM 44728 / CIP 108903 / NRRL B-16338 / NBRC 102104 / LLR-40K-21) TaxID=446470 RepID=D3Q3N8_STANL|nr:S8 family peptidase [Stackebrandtia nassauensis]ADD43955.1 peptidase S8 and S53 subtilisin kexin sedolisin [Stackebrandtia nassauensis DSM 44728]